MGRRQSQIRLRRVIESIGKLQTKGSRNELFSHQVRKLNFKTIARGQPNAASVFFLMQKFHSEDRNYKLCATCKNAIAKQNIFKICLANGLNFP